MKVACRKQTPSLCYDIIVVGGGSAGVASAVAAGRQGASVALLERNGFCGGMATAAEVGTICGLYHRSSSEAQYLEQGFSREFAERIAELSDSTATQFSDGLWYLPYAPEHFKLICDQFLIEAGVQVFLHSTVSSVQCENKCLKSLEALVWNESKCFEAKAFIDCSGEATVAQLSGAALFEEAGAQAGAIIFEISGVVARNERELFQMMCKSTFSGVHEGVLDPDSRRISLVPGSFCDGRVSVKLSLPEVAHQGLNHMTDVEQRARLLVHALVNHWSIASGEDSGSIRGVRLTHVSSQVGVRTGRRPLGHYVLTESDVTKCIKHEGAVAHCAWPIEQWGSGDGADLELLPEGECYSIPLKALCSRDRSNLFFAGRNISAEDRALASARVIGCCLATGFAAGTAAVLSIRKQGDKSLATATTSEVNV